MSLERHKDAHAVAERDRILDEAAQLKRAVSMRTQMRSFLHTTTALFGANVVPPEKKEPTV